MIVINVRMNFGKILSYTYLSFLGYNFITLIVVIFITTFNATFFVMDVFFWCNTFFATFFYIFCAILSVQFLDAAISVQDFFYHRVPLVIFVKNVTSSALTFPGNEVHN